MRPDSLLARIKRAILPDKQASSPETSEPGVLLVDEASKQKSIDLSRQELIHRYVAVDFPHCLVHRRSAVCTPLPHVSSIQGPVQEPFSRGAIYEHGCLRDDFEEHSR